MVIDSELLKVIKLHNVEISYALENRIDIDRIDLNLCVEKPELHIMSESTTASVILKHYITREGVMVSHINIPLFVFRNSSNVEVKPIEEDFNNVTNQLLLNGEYIEYRNTYGYAVYFPLEHLIFANKYIFGVYWKEIVNGDENVED